jgi:hypothetical protein
MLLIAAVSICTGVTLLSMRGWTGSFSTMDFVVADESESPSDSSDSEPSSVDSVVHALYSPPSDSSSDGDSDWGSGNDGEVHQRFGGPAFVGQPVAQPIAQPVALHAGIGEENSKDVVSLPSS